MKIYRLKTKTGEYTKPNSHMKLTIYEIKGQEERQGINTSSLERKI